MAKRERGQGGAGDPEAAKEHGHPRRGKKRPGEKKKPVSDTADQSVKGNVGEMVEHLLGGMATGSPHSARLLFELAEGKIAMEEIGTQKQIQSLAMMLSAAPAWDGSEQAGAEEA